MASRTPVTAAALATVCVLSAVGVGAASASSPGPQSDQVTTSNRAGSSQPAWEWMAANPDGTPARWDPCAPITWDWKKGKRRDVKVMKKATRQLSEALGVALNRDRSSPDVRIRFSKKPSQVGALGLGGFRYEESGGRKTIVQGYIEIDRKLKKKRSKRNYPKQIRKELFMHEWGHVVGLDHVDSRDELMYPMISGYITTYGHGDREGLAILGDTSACLRTKMATGRTTSGRQMMPGYFQPTAASNS